MQKNKTPQATSSLKDPKTAAPASKRTQTKVPTSASKSGKKTTTVIAKAYWA